VLQFSSTRGESYIACNSSSLSCPDRSDPGWTCPRRSNHQTVFLIHTFYHLVEGYLRKKRLLASVIMAITPSVWICFQLLTGGTRTDEPLCSVRTCNVYGFTWRHSKNPTRKSADASAAGEDGLCRSVCLRRMDFLRQLCSGHGLRALCGAFGPTHVPGTGAKKRCKSSVTRYGRATTCSWCGPDVFVDSYLWYSKICIL
jgi:hypothetical protein